jgi:hypothetical protein
MNAPSYFGYLGRIPINHYGGKSLLTRSEGAFTTFG